MLPPKLEQRPGREALATGSRVGRWEPAGLLHGDRPPPILTQVDITVATSAPYTLAEGLCLSFPAG